jgi:hypothetical protein
MVSSKGLAEGVMIGLFDEVVPFPETVEVNFPSNFCSCPISATRTTSSATLGGAVAEDNIDILAMVGSFLIAMSFDFSEVDSGELLASREIEL